MIPPSVKVCIVGALLLSSSVAGAGSASMICGKASIRAQLSRPTESLRKSQWMRIERTAKDQADAMKTKVQKLHEALLELEEKAEKERQKFVPNDFSFEDSTALVKAALKFDSVEEAKDKDCGYAGAPKVTTATFDAYDVQYWDSVDAFSPLADKAIGQDKKDFDAFVFAEACSSLIGSEMSTGCEGLCSTMSLYAEDIEVESDETLGGKTADELDQEAKEKRKEWERAKEEQEECDASVVTISGLVDQYNTAADVQRTHKRSSITARMTLRKQQMEMTELMVKFHSQQKNTTEAQEDFKTAVANLITARKNQKEAEAAQATAEAAQKAAEEAEEEARQYKIIAENTLQMWQEHLAELKVQIAEQAKLVKQTEEAVERADAASSAVSDFKDKLSTALVGLVRYYDESVRLPLRKMGIREEVKIEGLFPQADDTNAAENFKASIESTVNFCSGKKQHFEQLAEIEVESGTKLTAICDGQNWDAAQSEVIAAVAAKQERAISNLKTAQQKVALYAGPLADKTKGEVEGVWKAMALFGDTDFSKNYLSGWRFDANGAGKGSKKGFMMELASALEKAREEAIKMWEAAKAAMEKLEEEKVNAIESIAVAEKFLQDMISAWEAAREVTKQKIKETAEAVENTAKAKEATAKAIQEEEDAKIFKEKQEEMLAKVTKDKIWLEGEIQGTEAQVETLDGLMKKAADDLEAAHATAMGSFMELLHASENQENASWD